jgi:MFS superfamily sulfate permease-like transporter
VILDLSAAPFVDLQSAHTLAEIADELSAAGIRVQVVEARPAVRERLRGEGIDERVEGIDHFMSLAETIGRFQPL